MERTEDPFPFATLLLLAMGNLLICTNALSVSALATDLSHSFSIGVGEAAAFAVSYGAAYAGLAPLAAFFVEYMKAFHLLVVGLAFFAVSNLAAIMADTPEALHALRVIGAVGGVLFTPASIALAGSLVKKSYTARAISIVMLGLPMSALIGIPLLTLAAGAGGLPMAFGLLAFGGIALLLALLLVSQRFSAPARRGSVRFGQILYSPRGWIALSTTAVQTTAQYSFYTFSIVYFGVLGASETSTLLVISLFGLGAVAGNLLGGVAGDLLGKVFTQRIALVVMAGALLAIFLTAGEVRFAGPLALIWGISGYAFQAPQQARLLAIAPNAARAILALNSSAVYVGISAGAVLGGLVVEQDNVAVLPAVSTAVCVLALLMTYASKAVPLYTRDVP